MRCQPHHRRAGEGAQPRLLARPGRRSGQPRAPRHPACGGSDMRIGRDDVAKLRENDPRTPIAQEAEQTASPSWLEGQPMDPLATPAEPVPCLPGVPFAYAGAAALVVGPTGGGRSSLVQAALYDAARAGLRCAYLGSEITAEEFNARAAGIATARGDGLDDELRQELGAVRYLDLFETIAKAWS